jgi:thiol-disulfide isomerase/thioredoxin
LLAQEVAAKYGGRVAFVSENFGASKLARRFGVTRYPALFVDDVLVARPRDFGFFAKGENEGRYTPWRNAESQAKFKADLSRMVDLALAGKKEQLRREHAGAAADPPQQIAALPRFSLTDLRGRPLTEAEAQGRVVLVEFWATWCPPCRSTLEWLGGLQRKYGDRIAVLALAVESPEEQIRATAAALPDLRIAIADAPAARSFGDIMAVPTIFLFDRAGKTVRIVYGAPPDLHEQMETALRRAVE